MLGVFAEFETNLLRERQMEGIAKAKAEAKFKGRKPTARAKPGKVIQLTNYTLDDGNVKGEIKLFIDGK